MARKVIRAISHNGKEYFSLNHASSLCGYHKDYLGQLIRGGKLAGEKIGSSWFLEKSVFTRFCEENHAASFLSSQENARIDPVNQELIKEVRELKTKLAKFEKDPWDELLLGNDFQPFRKPRFLDFLNSLSFSPALLKPAIMIVAVSAAGTFVIRNPQLVEAGMRDISDFVKTSSDFVKISAGRIALGSFEFIDNLSLSLDRLQNKTELALNEISLDKLNLAQVQQAASFNFNGLKNSAVSAQSFLEKSLLNFGRKSGALVNEQNKEVIKTLTNLPQKAGETAGRFLNKTQDRFADLPKQVLGLFKYKTPPTLSEGEVRVPAPEDVGAELSPTEEKGLKDELSQLLSQGLTTEPSVKIEQTVVEKTIERIISGLSQKELDSAISAVNSRILAEVSELKGLIQKRSDENFRAIALSNRINNLSGVTITNTTVSGTISGIEDDDVPNDITVNTSKHLSGTTAAFTSTLDVSGASTLATTTISALTVTGILTASSSGLSLDSTGTTTVAGYLDVAKGAEFGANKAVVFHENSAANSLVIDSSGNLSSVGTLTISSTATSTIAGLLKLTRVPSIAHSFSVWSLGVATSSILNSSLLVNPASADADTILLALAVADSSKFFVDSEGDIFANSLTSVGGQTLSSTTASTLLVENNTTLGDAIGDQITINSGTTIFNNRSTTTIPNLTVNAWSIATSTSIVPTFTISTASSPFGFVGIGTTSPWASLSVAGQTAANYFTAVSNTASVFPYASTTALTISGTASTTNQVISSLISGRVPFASTAGLLIDSANLAWNNSVLRLTATYASTTAISGTNIDFGTLTLTSALGIASGGTNASSFTTSGNAVYYNGTSLLTAPLTSAITIPYASTTALTVSGTASTTNFVASAMTSGSVLFAGTAGLLSQDNSNLYWDDSNNRLGLASTSPWGLLSVNPNALGAGVPSFVVGSSTATSFIIDNGGRVGIGTTTPSKLSISTGASGAGTVAAATVVIEGTSATYLNFLTPSTNSSGLYFGDPSSATVGVLDYDHTNDSMRFQTNGAVQMTIASNGKVGIGTTSPYAKLSVEGQTVSSYFTATSTAFASTFPYASTTALTVSGTASTTNFIVSGTATSTFSGPLSSHSGDFIIGSSGTSNDLLLNPYGGNVGIGTTTPNVQLLMHGGSNAAVFDTNSTKNLDGSTLFIQRYRGGTSANSNAGFNYGAWQLQIFDATAGSEDSKLIFSQPFNGTDANRWTFVNGEIQKETAFTVSSLTAGLCWDNAGASSIEDCSSAPGDIAEWYESTSLNGKYPIAGDIVSVSQENNGLPSVSVSDGSSIPIGVVSTQPYQTFGEDILNESANPVMLALVGRAPIKVSLEGGDIKAGDPLSLSSVPGVAKKAGAGEFVVARALEAYDSTTDTNNLQGMKKVQEQITALREDGDKQVLDEQKKLQEELSKPEEDSSEGNIAQYQKNLEETIKYKDEQYAKAKILEDDPTVKIMAFLGGGYFKLDGAISGGSVSGGFWISNSAGIITTNNILDLSGQGIINVNYITSANWRILENGTLEAKKVVADRIEVKKPFGITIYDTVTGGPVCVISEAGVLRSLTGSCETNETATLGVNEPQTPSVIPPADTTAPVITIIGANPAEIEVGSIYGDLGATVSDNVDQNLGYTASLNGGPWSSQGTCLTTPTLSEGEVGAPTTQCVGVDTSVAGTHTITYKAVDNAGNVGTAQRTVNVVDLTASSTPQQ